MAAAAGKKGATSLLWPLKLGQKGSGLENGTLNKKKLG